MKVRYATIIVADMGESIGFYSDVMGFEVDSQFKPVPGVVITLMEVEDLSATVEALKAKGAKITLEPVRALVGGMAFIEDPNGVKIALIQHD